MLVIDKKIHDLPINVVRDECNKLNSLDGTLYQAYQTHHDLGFFRQVLFIDGNHKEPAKIAAKNINGYSRRRQLRF